MSFETLNVNKIKVCDANFESAFNARFWHSQETQISMQICILSPHAPQTCAGFEANENTVKYSKIQQNIAESIKTPLNCIKIQ
jgi:hypothetical protein